MENIDLNNRLSKWITAETLKFSLLGLGYRVYTVCGEVCSGIKGESRATPKTFKIGDCHVHGLVVSAGSSQMRGGRGLSSPCDIRFVALIIIAKHCFANIWKHNHDLQGFGCSVSDSVFRLLQNPRFKNGDSYFDGLVVSAGRSQMGGGRGLSSPCDVQFCVFVAMAPETEKNLIICHGS